jgi:putative flippase GtrA
MTSLRIQGLRFALVGLGSNLVLYLLYLFLTTAGLGHKTAMTLLFAIGTLQTFIANRAWTFAYKGGVRGSFVRYVATYAVAYLLNLAALLVFVDQMDFPHQLVQGAMTLTLALMLFLAHRYWVFRMPAAACPR